MHVTLIMPAMGCKPGEPYVASWKMEPLGLATLAALTPPEISLSFFDDRLEPIIYDQPTDLVAINVETYTARRAYDIARRFRQRAVPVIMGGYHATLMPEETAQHCDSVLLGEAEQLWGKILMDAAAGRLADPGRRLGPAPRPAATGGKDLGRARPQRRHPVVGCGLPRVRLVAGTLPRRAQRARGGLRPGDDRPRRAASKALSTRSSMAATGVLKLRVHEFHMPWPLTVVVALGAK